MTDTNAKGYRYMRSICTWLNANGWPYATIRSKGQSGSDILETPGILWELKAVQKTSLGAWLDQAQQDADHENADIACVVHKRRGCTDPAAQFVTVDLATFNRLLIDAAYTTGPVTGKQFADIAGLDINNPKHRFLANLYADIPTDPT